MVRKIFQTLVLFLGIISSSFSVIIVDVSSCKEQFTFDSDNFEKISSNRSVRVLTFDTEKQKIDEIQYLLITQKRVIYNKELPFLRVRYQSMPDDQIDIKITSKNPDNLYYQEGVPLHTNKAYETQKTFSDLAEWFNKHTLVSKDKTRRPSIKKADEISLTAYFNDTKTKKINFYDGTNNSEKGWIGERLCKLTFIVQGFQELDGKCGADNGFDAVFSKDDLVVISEVKLHKKTPSLDEIFSTHLKAKFSSKDKRAITKIKEDVKETIAQASTNKKLHLLAYAILKNGKVDCRLDKEPYLLLEDNPSLIKPAYSLPVSFSEETSEEDLLEFCKGIVLSLSDQTKKDTEILKGIFNKAFETVKFHDEEEKRE